MCRLKLILGLAIVFAGMPAAAAEGQPTQQVLKIQSDGQWTLTSQLTKPVWKQEEYTYTVMVPVTVTKEVIENGVARQVQVTQYKPETRTATRSVSHLVMVMKSTPVDLKTVRAFETDGRPIQTEDVARRCPKETLVVVSATDEMIPKYYAEVFKPGTIILAMPLRPAGAVMMAPALPRPTPPAEAPRAPSAPPSGASASPAFSVRQVAYQDPGAAAPGVSDSRPPLPVALAPELVFVSRDGAEDLKIRQYEESPLETEISVLDNDSSIAPEKMMKVRQLRRRSVTTSLPLSAMRISYPREGTASPDRLKEKLGQGEITAALSVDGKLVDEFWLQNLKSTVPVIRGVKLPPTFPHVGYGQIHMAPSGAPVPPSAPPPAPTPTPKSAPAAGPKPGSV